MLSLLVLCPAFLPNPALFIPIFLKLGRGSVWLLYTLGSSLVWKVTHLVKFKAEASQAEILPV